MFRFWKSGRRGPVQRPENDPSNEAVGNGDAQAPADAGRAEGDDHGAHVPGDDRRADGGASLRNSAVRGRQREWSSGRS
jgi:hypothetical protein